MNDPRTPPRSWPGYLAAFLGGALSWFVISYVRQLRGKPPLVRLPIEERVLGHMSTGEQAVQIASADLRAGIERRYLPDGTQKKILCAGMRNFREPWARDFSFASFGLLELDEVEATRETLEVFLLNQTMDGQFPVKIGSTGVVNRYFHALFGRQQPIDTPLRPKYVTAHNTISLDGNALLVIAALNYMRHINDPGFVDVHWDALKRALNWLESIALHEQDGLLHQGAYTDWADSINRVGRVLYTNVLYWKALQSFAVEARQYGRDEDHALFCERADRVREAINTHFWRADRGYFVTSEQFDILNSDGNLLAVAWGLATPEQAHRILDVMRDLRMADPVPTQVTDRDYGPRFVAIENRLAGIGHYHTLAAWLWLGGWHVVALSRVGRLQEARELLDRMSALIVRDQVVHEVYDNHGRFLRTFWYTSEAPLTWSAGMFVYARAVYQRATSGESQG